MNFLTIPSEGNAAVLGNTRFPLPGGLTAPDRIVLGIRPEHVRLAQPGDQHTVQGRVFLVENLGMHDLVSVRVENRASESMTIRTLLPVKQKCNSGETVTLALPADSIHWFDQASGDRLQSSQEVTASTASV